MSTTELLKLAQAARPPVRSKTAWAHLLPVVETLRAQRFTVAEACRWLVENGAIPEGDAKRAYNSIRQTIRRNSRP